MSNQHQDNNTYELDSPQDTYNEKVKKRTLNPAKVVTRGIAQGSSAVLGGVTSGTRVVRGGISQGESFFFRDPLFSHSLLFFSSTLFVRGDGGFSKTGRGICRFYGNLSQAVCLQQTELGPECFSFRNFNKPSFQTFFFYFYFCTLFANKTNNKTKSISKQ